jgi:hypothetical protein
MEMINKAKLKIIRVSTLISVFSIIFAIIFGIAFTGCSPSQTSQTTSFTEPTIPTNYQTYTDETSAFSISYPHGWEVAQSVLEQLEQTTKDTINKINSNLPIEKASIIFFAGLPIQDGYYPNIVVVVEPLPVGVKNQDTLIESEILGIKGVISDYNELSRIKTKIDGIDASIIEYSGTFPNAPKTHYLVMGLYKGQIAWSLTCSSYPEDFDKWKGDFQSIVRSLRILK